MIEFILESPSNFSIPIKSEYWIENALYLENSSTVFVWDIKYEIRQWLTDLAIPHKCYFKVSFNSKELLLINDFESSIDSINLVFNHLSDEMLFKLTWL